MSLFVLSIVIKLSWKSFNNIFLKVVVCSKTMELKVLFGIVNYV